MVGSGSAAYGQGWDMDAIAACVVGGVSFTGGIGKISGVVTGVCIFTALTYSLTILGIDTNLQFVFSGIIILVAVTLDCLKYVQKKYIARKFLFHTSKMISRDVRVASLLLVCGWTVILLELHFCLCKATKQYIRYVII